MPLRQQTLDWLADQRLSPALQITWSCLMMSMPRLFGMSALFSLLNIPTGWYAHINGVTTDAINRISNSTFYEHTKQDSTVIAGRFNRSKPVASAGCKMISHIPQATYGSCGLSLWAVTIMT